MNVATTLQHVYESWWFDPLTATFGFIVPVYVYTYYEIQTGSSVYTTFDQFLTSRGTGEDKRQSLLLSLFSYWIGVALFVQIVPKPADGLPLGIPTSFSSLGLLMAEVIAGIILYDGFFFLVHWAMHECRALHYLSHKEHHRPKVLEARHVLR
jgi:sterol desaturase/sphingolipid hydroxylase (fatty acid hydroxylase superfamily)